MNQETIYVISGGVAVILIISAYYGGKIRGFKEAVKRNKKDNDYFYAQVRAESDKYRAEVKEQSDKFKAQVMKQSKKFREDIQEETMKAFRRR